MLDKRKIRLMTKLALYEQNEGREDMKISAYYKKRLCEHENDCHIYLDDDRIRLCHAPGPWLGNDRLDGETDAGSDHYACGGDPTRLSCPPDHYIYHHQQDIQQETQRCENADEKI